jgi:hypothetical protein
MAERTLLACLLTRSSVFAHGEEDIGSLSFSTAGPERLRQALVEVLANDPDAAGADIGAALRARGLADEVAEVFADPLLARHRALRQEASADDIVALWRENISVVRANSGTGDDPEAGASDLADEAMRRRLLLKRAELDGADDDVI